MYQPGPTAVFRGPSGANVPVARLCSSVHVHAHARGALDDYYAVTAAAAHDVTRTCVRR